MMLAGSLVGPAVAGATAAAAKGTGAPAPTTTLPALPKVPLSVTDGETPQALLATAVALSSLGIDTSALQSAISVTQAKLVALATTANKAKEAAARADQEAGAARAVAGQAQSDYDSLDGAVRSAVMTLYISGPAYMSLNPAAGDALAYAQDYASTALTPTGVLARRASDASAHSQALAAARKAQKRADHQAAVAAAALAAEQGEAHRLQQELASISTASAAQVAADHTSLASQAGQNLLSDSGLQFKPAHPLPAPLTTTPVALAWAFAELGKPYVWAATGPATFDCSGLTQYVWRQAGVSIPRVAADQYSWALPVPLSQLLPGDLVFFGRTDIHHVGIYIGGGLMINAPHTGDVVRVSSIWWADLAGFGRVHAAGTPVPTHAAPSPAKPAPPVVKPTAGPVPSQTKPPAGWKPTPGSTTPIVVPAPGATTTTVVTTTTLPGDPTTTIAPDPTTTVADPTSTVVPADVTTTTSTTAPAAP